MVRLHQYYGIVATLLLLLFWPVHAAAHNLDAECKLVGNRVEVEAFYDDDTPARQARVRVLDARQEVLFEGKTDEQGKWSFPRPAPGEYKVEIDAGAGHRRPVTMTIPGPRANATTEKVIEAAVRISESAGREELTRFPWQRLLLGLLIIAALSGFFLLVSRRRRPQRDEATP
jgi:hypothetical protein